MKSFPTFQIPLIFVTLGVMSLPAHSFEPPPALALDDMHYVLKNRQKFIELRGFSDYEGTLYNPDSFDCEIVSEPTLGDLYPLGGKSYLYIPDANSDGLDSFTFECGSTALNTGTVTINIVDLEFDPNGIPENPESQFVMPYGLGAPTFGAGMMENSPAVPSPWNDPVSGFYYVDLSVGVDGGGNPDWPNGSSASPRLTIPDCLEAGDVVEVHGYGDPDRR